MFICFSKAFDQFSLNVKSMSHLVLWIGTLGLSTDSYGIGMTGE